MENLFRDLLSASVYGSVIILAVLLLRIVLRRAPKKFICYLWMLAGLRLLLPVPLESRFSIQPSAIALPISEKLSGILPIFWGVIALAAASYSVISYLHLRSRVGDAVKVKGGWESDRIETAFVLGFLKPKIYIPTGISASDREQILAHERTHLDKGDHWIKMVGFLALVLHWFNPLVWLSYALLCRDIEMACDERVVQFMELDERRAYASALLNCSTNHVHYAACPVAFGEVSVKYRIRSALKYKKPGFWLSLLAVLAVAFVIVCLFTSPVRTVEVVVDEQKKLQESSHQDPLTYIHAPMPECEPNPDCGMDLRVDVTSPTGGSVVYVIDRRYADANDRISFDTATVERWNGTAWEAVGTVSGLPLEVGIGGGAKRNVNIMSQSVDWSLSLGNLPAGDYRLVQTISTAARSDMFRAPFRIYREELPREEEAAVTRCVTALDQQSSGVYTVQISEGNSPEALAPKRQITYRNGIATVEHYLGEYTVWKSAGETAQQEAHEWDASFRQGKNRKILFPEGGSCITQEKIQFSTVWVDYFGAAHRERFTFCFTENGRLLSAERQDDTLNMDGKVDSTQIVRADIVSQQPFVPSGMDTYLPKDSLEAQRESPWGVYFRVEDDNLKPSGGDVIIATNAVGVVKDYTDGTYWLEKRVGDRWQRLGGEEKTASWGSETVPLRSQSWIGTVDWTADYGNLDAGVYRMGKHFYRDSEAMIQYAEFVIFASGGTFGEGGVEALARVDAAIAKLQTQPYRVERWYADSSKYSHDYYLDCVIWHEGDVQVEDYYEQEEYQRSIVTEKDGPLADLFYGSWLRRSEDNEAYDCMFFPEGYSLISDREIRFTQCPTTEGWTDLTREFTYRFDENGNLVEILASGEWMDVRYIITPTAESEIHEWIAQKQAEENT